MVHFHKRRLSEDQNLYTRVGDFIYYGDQYYEITTLKEPRPLFGQVDQSFEITAVCTRARGSYFDANWQNKTWPDIDPKIDIRNNW